MEDTENRDSLDVQMHLKASPKVLALNDKSNDRDEDSKNDCAENNKGSFYISKLIYKLREL